MEALVLTAEKAGELGFAGAGPFTFGGAFPGEYLLDEPIGIHYLGFDSVDAAKAAYDEAFADAEVAPLEWVEVGEGEGKPYRQNHALSEFEAVEVGAAELADEADRVRTHADADALGAELGISFAPDAKLDEKRDAISSFRAGAVAVALDAQAEGEGE